MNLRMLNSNMSTEDRSKRSLPSTLPSNDQRRIQNDLNPFHFGTIYRIYTVKCDTSTIAHVSNFNLACPLAAPTSSASTFLCFTTFCPCIKLAFTLFVADVRKRTFDQEFMPITSSALLNCHVTVLLQESCSRPGHHTAILVREFPLDTIQWVADPLPRLDPHLWPTAVSALARPSR